MSNAGARQRKTVPLRSSSHHADEGDSSVPTDESSVPTSSTSGTSSSQSTGVSRSNQTAADVSVSTRRLEPIRQSFLNDRKVNNRESKPLASPGISTKELRLSMKAKRISSERTIPSTPKTVPEHANLFSVPNSSAKQRALGDMTELYGLDQTLESSCDSFSKTSYAVRTPFEVDAPRGDAPRPSSCRRMSSRRSVSPSGRSIMSEATNPNLSKEQDAWAGIDALLESRSLDDSFCFSTSEILPKATVKALRRETKEGLTDLDEETVWGDEESDAGESRTSKRSLESISKTSSTSSNSSRLKGHSTTRKSKTEQEVEGNQQSWNSREGRRQHRGSGAGDAGIFDMFQWSDKDNVDEERMRKGKLNSRSLKAKLLPVVIRKSESQHDSDTSSLPSLATYRQDDFSVKSGAQSLGWDTYHSTDCGSVVTENSRDEFGFESVAGDFSKQGNQNRVELLGESDCSDHLTKNTISNSRTSLAGDGLVLDKGVDEYIRKIQRSLPTITEDEDCLSGMKGKKKKKHVGFAIQGEESSPSPTSVLLEETAFDELPSLSSLSGQKFEQSQQNLVRKGRMEEKKELKPSLTFLMSSIKKMTTKAKSNKYLGDEEKYFPEAIRNESKSNKYSANRCLLSEGNDGVNWDAD